MPEHNFHVLFVCGANAEGKCVRVCAFEYERQGRCCSEAGSGERRK